MVVGAFPILKLGTILLKQISRPIANFVKERAKSNQFFRTYVCMPPAQFYNWCEIKTKMWILNLGKPVNIPVLNEAMAIELGANLLGEGIVFCMGAAVLIAEYTRGARKEETKEEQRKEELRVLVTKLHDLYFRVEQQDTQLRELSRMVVSIESKRSIVDLFRGDNKDSAKGEKIAKSSVSYQNASQTNQLVNEKENVTVPIKMENVSLVIRAAETIQHDLTSERNTSYQDNGLLENALWYIQHDVYRTPLSVK